MFPEWIKCVAVAAPAGPAAREQAEKGIAFLRALGRKVKVMPHVFAGDSLPYLSAPAEARAADLAGAWLDPEVDMILCTRGGFGSAHILNLLDWTALAQRNMIVAGYSDITALHFAMEKHCAGTAVAAPMLGSISRLREDAYSASELAKAFDTASPRQITPPGAEKLTVLKPGYAKALPLAGNLAVAASMCGTGYLPDSRGRLIVLEDLNEAPYRIDRYLTQLMQSGFFDGCAGIALGGFTGCGDRELLRSIFMRLTSCTSGPVAMDFPFGHTFPMTSLNFAQPVEFSVQG